VGFSVNWDNVSLKNIIASQQLPTSLVTPAFHEKKAKSCLPTFPSFKGPGRVIGEGRGTLSSLH
jgi:hypothetical protein